MTDTVPAGLPPGGAAVPLSWVDDLLLDGPDSQTCLHLGGPVTRARLRQLVEAEQVSLIEQGLTRGGTLALNLPPSMAYVACLLAGWRIGAQVSLLDHRLTSFETDAIIDRLAPQVIVTNSTPLAGGLRAFQDATTQARRNDAGAPATTAHALLQLSSGSTGPSKVIGRSAQSLIDEVNRYRQMDGVPLPGERVVLMASMVHVLGLVGGLLYCLANGIELVLPQRLTVDSILKSIADGAQPTSLLGVPFHIELLAAVDEPPELPNLVRMTTGGELVRASVSERFTDRYGIILGNMYGMTEVGVIATDLYGRHRPAVAPAPGIAVSVSESGELLVAMAQTPYVGLSDPTRWMDGWLHTRDAGSIDATTGAITIAGRLDSQVSVGGLKVDLTEVEHALAALPGVEAAVVIYDGAIEAFAVIPDQRLAAEVPQLLAARLAPYKRPKAIHVLAQLPRTATGKLIRDRATLRSAQPT